MKVAIVGDRKCNDYDLLCRAIQKSGFDITEIVSGGAQGADRLAELYAKKNNLPIKVFPADWNNTKGKNVIVKVNQWGKKYNANAGFNRNSEIVAYADAVIALQPMGESSGTQDTIRKAKQMKIPIYVYEKEDYEYEYKF